MNEIEILFESFEYDLWSNLEWLNAIGAMPQPQRPMEVMNHIVWAQEIWLSRIREDVEPGDPGNEESRLRAINASWIETVRAKDLTEVIAYKNTSGDAYRRGLGAIARHVVDHGTYHRGHLRGLAEMQGWDAFPEVGLNGFYFVRELHT